MTSNWTKYQSESSKRCSRAEWQRIRTKVLQRDERRCQLRLRGCRIDGNQVDHILSIGRGGADDMDNCECVCAPCHAKKTAREAAAGRNRRKRKPPRHPADALS